MKIYFAVPISKYYKKAKHKWIPKSYESLIKKIIFEIEKLGHVVYCPLREDHAWGRKFPPLKKLCFKQYNKITKESDILIAYLGRPQSAGVAIEIGYAISHKIPVIIIKKPKEKITLAIKGLSKISPCKIIEFKNDKELIKKLKKAIKLYAPPSFFSKKGS
jgi:hypothetical protein